MGSLLAPVNVAPPAHMGHGIGDAVTWLLPSEGPRLLGHVSLCGRDGRESGCVRPWHRGWLTSGQGVLGLEAAWGDWPGFPGLWVQGHPTTVTWNLAGGPGPHQKPGACLALGRSSTNVQAASRVSDRQEGSGCAPPPPEDPSGSTGLPGSGPLTGLGGSFWLRALWILPISVCELEWDKPSKYGLGGADGERVILQYLPELKAQPLRLAGSDAQQGPHP